MVRYLREKGGGLVAVIIMARIRWMRIFTMGRTITGRIREDGMAEAAAMEEEVAAMEAEAEIE